MDTQTWAASEADATSYYTPPSDSASTVGQRGRSDGGGDVGGDHVLNGVA